MKSPKFCVGSLTPDNETSVPTQSLSPDSRPLNSILANSTSAKSIVDLSRVKLNLRDKELVTTWSSAASEIICINPFCQGLAVSIHTNYQTAGKGNKYKPEHFHLRLKENRDSLVPPGKYYTYRSDYLAELEHLLTVLDEQGRLKNAVVYFGVFADPFLKLHYKFKITIDCLDMLSDFRPRFLVVQSRSPMVIAGLPFLKKFGDDVAVVMPLETCSDRVISRYTPGQPSVNDRLMAADGIRAQGVKVNLCVSPVLPYGDIYTQAASFSEMLLEHADYITFGSISDGSQEGQSQLRSLPLAAKLLEDKQSQYIQPHCYRVLYATLKKLAPEKLLLPVVGQDPPTQLEIFSA